MVRSAIALLIAAAPFAEARADLPRLGIFRKKKDDAPAAEKDKAVKVKSLIEALKSEPDEKKRQTAVEELSEFDPRTHIEVVPALVVSVKQDPSAGVRALAAEAIGEMKPVTQTAGVALEQTLQGDPSEAVRKAAEKALWQYHLNGYRSAGVNPSLPQSAEPPLAKPRVIAQPISSPVKAPATTTSAAKPMAEGGVYQQTIEPPLAKPKVETVQPPTPSLAVPPLPAAPVVPSAPTVPTIPPPGS